MRFWGSMGCRPLQIVLKRNGFRYFVEFWPKGGESLKCALALAIGDKNRCWLTSVQETIQNTANRFTLCEELRGLRLDEVCKIIFASPLGFKRMFRKALLHPPLDPYLALETNSNKSGKPSAAVDPIAMNTFRCQVCATAFADQRALAAHLSKVHSQRNPVELLLRGGPVCHGCGKDFQTIERIIQHLARPFGRPCREAIAAKGIPLNAEELLELRSRRTNEGRVRRSAGVRAHQATKLARRIIGPVMK